MVQRIGGFRRKTRHKLKKSVRTRGKISISRYFQKLKVDDMVQLVAEPSIHKGLYFPKYHGKHGIVKGKRGNCYEVKVKAPKREKIIIVHPIHLRKI
jgi:large subunit ribosomal protein L21e